MIEFVVELTRQVREQTIGILRRTPADWLLWAPEPTSNHILWHVGHALWVQDVLAIEPLTGRSELPPGWAETFGADCRPVRETRDWPDAGTVADQLQHQWVRLYEAYRSHADLLFDSAVVADLIHGLHDEARHQGEMHLLTKLRRAQNS